MQVLAILLDWAGCAGRDDMPGDCVRYSRETMKAAFKTRRRKVPSNATLKRAMAALAKAGAITRRSRLDIASDARVHGYYLVRVVEPIALALMTDGQLAVPQPPATPHPGGSNRGSAGGSESAQTPIVEPPREDSSLSSAKNEEKETTSLGGSATTPKVLAEPRTENPPPVPPPDGYGPVVASLEGEGEVPQGQAESRIPARDDPAARQATDAEHPAHEAPASETLDHSAVAPVPVPPAPGTAGPGFPHLSLPREPRPRADADKDTARAPDDWRRELCGKVVPARLGAFILSCICSTGLLYLADMTSLEVDMLVAHARRGCELRRGRRLRPHDLLSGMHEIHHRRGRPESTAKILRAMEEQEAAREKAREERWRHM